MTRIDYHPASMTGDLWSSKVWFTPSRSFWAVDQEWDDHCIRDDGVWNRGLVQWLEKDGTLSCTALDQLLDSTGKCLEPVHWPASGMHPFPSSHAYILLAEAGLEPTLPATHHYGKVILVHAARGATLLTQMHSYPWREYLPDSPYQEVLPMLRCDEAPYGVHPIFQELLPLVVRGSYPEERNHRIGEAHRITKL